jgi:hypothetical protein
VHEGEKSEVDTQEKREDVKFREENIALSVVKIVLFRRLMRIV